MPVTVDPEHFRTYEKKRRHFRTYKKIEDVKTRQNKDEKRREIHRSNKTKQDKTSDPDKCEIISQGKTRQG